MGVIVVSVTTRLHCLTRNATPTDARERTRRESGFMRAERKREFWTTVTARGTKKRTRKPWHAALVNAKRQRTIASRGSRGYRRYAISGSKRVHSLLGLLGRSAREKKEGRRRERANRPKKRVPAEKGEGLGRGPGANRRPLERAGPHTATPRPRPFLFSFF